MTDPAPNTNRNVSTVSRHLALDARFNGTGVVRPSSGPVGTGCLIADRWVLTARHVVCGASTGTFVLSGTNLPIVRFHTRDDTDIALAELGQSARGYPVTGLYDGAGEVGRQVYLVGCGLSGEFTGNPRELANGGRHAAMNTIADASDCGGAIGEALVIRYRGKASGALPLEGAVAPGDSGAPVFVEDKGKLRVVGHTYGVIPGQDGFFFGRVSRYIGWIRSVISAAPLSRRPR